MGTVKPNYKISLTFVGKKNQNRKTCYQALYVSAMLKYTQSRESWIKRHRDTATMWLHLGRT